MKTLKSIFAFLILASTICCNTNDPIVDPNINNGDLKVILIDTAKINSIKTDGTSEQILINRKFNTSSYISGLCFNNEGTRMIYVDEQNPNFTGIKSTIRSANLDGSDDKEIYQVMDDMQIDMIKVTDDNKIFAIQSNGQLNSIKNITMNLDGTGVQVVTGYRIYTDLTKNKKYAISRSGSGTNPNRISIIDLTGDAGAGSLYMNVDFPDFPYEGSFSNDGKYAIIPFKDGANLKLRVVDMVAKTFTDKIIKSNYTGSWAYLFARLSNDGKKLVYTIAGDTPKSETIIFNLSDNTSSSFLNNDDNIFEVYPY